MDLSVKCQHCNTLMYFHGDVHNELATKLIKDAHALRDWHAARMRHYMVALDVDISQDNIDVTSWGRGTREYGI